jgi:hypothetical protein
MQKVELQWEGQQNIRRKHRESNEYSTWEVSSARVLSKVVGRKSRPRTMSLSDTLTLASTVLVIITSLHTLI